MSYFISLTVGKLLRIPLAVLAASLLARAVGPEGVGQWAMLLAVTTMLHSFLLGWTQAYNVRFGREEWTLHHRLASTWAVRGPIIAISFGLAATLLILQPFSFLENFFNLSQTWWPWILLYVLGHWWLAESHSLYRITGKIGRLAVIPLVVDLAIVALLAALFFQPHESRVELAFPGMVIITTVISGIAWFVEFKPSNSLSGTRDFVSIQKFIAYSGPLLPGLVFTYLSNWGDHILLQYFKSVKDVGFFNAGYMTLSALMGLTASIPILFLPKLIDKKISDPEAERDYVERVIPTLVSLWLIFIILALIFIPWFFLIVFGLEFEPAIPILLVLCIAIPGSIFSAIYAILFELQGRLGRSSLYAAAMFAVNFIITLGLIVKYGALGAAIGTSISFILVQTLYLLDQHRFLKVPKFKTIILLVFSSLYGLSQWAMGDNLVVRLGGALAGLICLGVLVRNLNLGNKAILIKLFPKNLPGHNFIVRLMIQNNSSPD
ncbi:MAG: oligosaccharide flippase family protein [Flavobacterium sp.]|nr:oligosaccharide flippase family protein [Flavobacterium sp.]